MRKKWYDLCVISTRRMTIKKYFLAGPGLKYRMMTEMLHNQEYPATGSLADISAVHCPI